MQGVAEVLCADCEKRPICTEMCRELETYLSSNCRSKTSVKAGLLGDRDIALSSELRRFGVHASPSVSVLRRW